MVRLYQEEDGEAEVKAEKSWAIEQSNSAKKAKKVRSQHAASPSCQSPFPVSLPRRLVTDSYPPPLSLSQSGGKRKSAGEGKKATKTKAKAPESTTEGDAMDVGEALEGAEKGAVEEDDAPKSAKKAKKAPKEKKEKASSKKRAADDSGEPKVRINSQSAMDQRAQNEPDTKNTSRR